MEYDMNDKIEMFEIMKILKCSRYKVMKYYVEDDLPLIKENNRYYIVRSEFTEWLEERRRLERISTIISLSVFGVILLILIIVLIVIF